MLVISRKQNEKIVLPQLGIVIIQIDIRGDKSRIGIEADREIVVHRWEVWEAIQRNNPEEAAMILARKMIVQP